MRIAQLLMPVHSLGPGERICLWTQGCSKGCKGCISPEMQPHDKGNTIDEIKLAQALLGLSEVRGYRRLTISGGDPFEQSESLLRLLKIIRGGFEDILVYTGFTMDQIKDGAAGKAGIRCLELIDILVDGRYEERLNFSDVVLRGSANQKVYFFNEKLKKDYEDYMSRGRTLETFIHNDTVIITGIMNRSESNE